MEVPDTYKRTSVLSAHLQCDYILWEISAVWKERPQTSRNISKNQPQQYGYLRLKKVEIGIVKILQR